MKTKTILILLAAIFIYSCSAKLMILTQEDADRGKAKFTSATLESLNEGKNIYQQNCNQCHGLKSPLSRTEEKWNKVVPLMVKKVNQKLGKEEINAKKQELLLQYLITMTTAQKHK